MHKLTNNCHQNSKSLTVEITLNLTDITKQMILKMKRQLLLEKVFSDIVFSSRVASVVGEAEPSAYLHGSQHKQCD